MMNTFVNMTNVRYSPGDEADEPIFVILGVFFSVISKKQFVDIKLY
jgi:hypothetical protein